jgi:hypothetical protein
VGSEPPLALASRSSPGAFTSPAPYRLGRRSSRRGTYPAASCFGQTTAWWYRTVYLLSIAPRPSGRGLGPTNPPRITLAAEPSGFRWWGFAPHFSVTHSGIRTRRASTAGFRCCFCGPSTLPYHAGRTTCILGFGTTLCPAGLSAHRHSTSELLRTLSRVAASKPTSWLSAHRHILSHSASIWGP